AMGLEPPHAPLVQDLIGDVVHDLGGADDDPVGVPYRRKRERHIQDRPILAHPLSAVMGERLATGYALDQLQFAVAPVGREKRGHRPAYNLVGPVAEYAL